MVLPNTWAAAFWCFLGLVLFPLVLHANKAHQMLVDRTDEERNEALTVLLHKNKNNCDVVVRNFFQGFEPEGGAFWNVTCGNEQSFMILIENDARGSTRIMDCVEIQSLTKGKHECFKKLK